MYNKREVWKEGKNMDVRKLSGYWCSSDYVGTMPDGRKQRFVSDKEYEEAFNDVLEEEMEKLRDILGDKEVSK